ncbi:UNVERIFIED_CONTAM: hypothetical protein GTU68_020892 [Idotea baltica]|nr:hypothetical protein [Idotea baltica]
MFSVGATFISKIPFFSDLGLSALVIGISLGIVFANFFHKFIPGSWDKGIAFSAKKILRFAIVFYGFQITFQDIHKVGLEGVVVSFSMVLTTMIIGSLAGTKLFKLDRDTSILIASGGAVCGAAAVLATEPVLKAKEYKTAIAVSMVVVFGTLSMFLYPPLYSFMDPNVFGIYTGGTIHEVAQVVAVPASIVNSSASMAHDAVIVKMTRVLLIAPMLICLGFILSYLNKNESESSSKTKIVIPWFAVYFIVVAILNSFIVSVFSIINNIKIVDTFLLTMAMTALGMNTKFSKFKGLGLAPIYTGSVMYVWLVVGGFLITKAVVAVF